MYFTIFGSISLLLKFEPNILGKFSNVIEGGSAPLSVGERPSDDTQTPRSHIPHPENEKTFFADTKQAFAVSAVETAPISVHVRVKKSKELDCWVYNKPFKTAGTSVMNALISLNGDRGGIAAPDNLEHFLGPSADAAGRILGLGRIDFFGSHVKISADVLDALSKVCRGRIVLITSVRDPIDVYRSWYMQQRQSLYPATNRTVVGPKKEVSYRMWLATANRHLIMDYMDGRNWVYLPVSERIQRIVAMYDEIFVYERLNTSLTRICRQLGEGTSCPEIPHLNDRKTDFEGLPSRLAYVKELRDVAKDDILLYKSFVKKAFS